MNTQGNAPGSASSAVHADPPEAISRRSGFARRILRHLLLIVFGISVLAIGFYSPDFLAARNLAEAKWGAWKTILRVPTE